MRIAWSRLFPAVVLGFLANAAAAAAEKAPQAALRVGAAAVNLKADDSLPMAGIAGRPKSQGQEGELRVTAVVIDKPGIKPLAIVACDVLWVTREMVDPAVDEIERTTGIPANNILVNATHTHHAPATTRTHDWDFSEAFRNEVEKAIVKSVQDAHAKLPGGEARFFFHLAQEATIGANSRLLLEDGRITWLNPLREAAGKGKPTGPFDPDLPVLDFRDPQGNSRALIYNHSTHTIGTRSGQNVRSASFYGLAAQDLEGETGGIISFLEGASGSTHNIAGVPVPELIDRLKNDLREARKSAKPRDVSRLASLRRPFKFKVRVFDDAEEDAKIAGYAEKYAPQSVDYWRKLFGGMRAELKLHQGEERETWIQALVIGDVALVGVPAEYFTSLGVDIKQRSPFRETYVAELANDWIGYLPDRKAHELGGYQTWMGLHSFAEIGTGERIADEVVKLLHELSGKEKPAEGADAGAGPRGSPREPQQAPRSPEDERSTFRLADPQLAVDLVAAEPDVDSPVAMAWDAAGVLYVAEMIEYPAGQPAGRVRRLEDRDRDGHYERVTVFAGGLPMVNSVLPWNDGVLVTAAPDILFLKDTDGDGVADERRIVLTGFVVGNPQLLVNGLAWGLDNRVYGANGRSDGEIRRPEDPPGKAVSIRRHDFRFRPDTGEVEAIAGFSQFGLGMDDWGNRFPSWNTIPIRHVVLEERYLNRNPHMISAATAESILDPRDAGRIYPISVASPRFNRESVDFFNASCSPCILRGGGLGDSYRGDAFVCEPLTNLVHRCVLEARGPTFNARRLESEREFLASTDPWFHPVNLVNGPDGALYVADFYRQWVEHPQWVPEARRNEVDWRNGARHGRIWRIRRKDVPPAAISSLKSLASAGLVDELMHPDAWRRMTAQRLLVERQDSSVAPSLRELTGHAESAAARIHALWTLHGLGTLDDVTLTRLLGDDHPRVREQAVIAFEQGVSGNPQRLAELLALTGDEDPKVRLQVAALLGGRSGQEALRGLVALIQRDVGSSWARLAVLSGLTEDAAAFLDALSQAAPGWLQHPTAEQAGFLNQLASIIGVRSREQEIARVLSRVTAGDARQGLSGRLALLTGLGDGLARTRQPLDAWLADSSSSEKVRAFQASLKTLLSQAQVLCESRDAATEDRLMALEALIQTRSPEARDLLLRLLTPENPLTLQSAAARGLVELSDREAVVNALDRLSTLAIGVRRDLIAALLSRSSLADLMLDRLESDELSYGDLDPAAREALQHVKGEALQKRAQSWLKSHAPGDRKAIVQQFAGGPGAAGDATRGKELFARYCGVCHRLAGDGGRVGPDLSGVRARPTDALLVDILNPNEQVGADFFGYVLVTKQGRIITGLLVAETAASVTLRATDGQDHVVLRTEIDEFRGTGRTVMPDGLETQLGDQGVWDVIAWLRQPREAR